MNWNRGKTLVTPQTEKWSEEQIKNNDKIEMSVVFSDFRHSDNGRSREAVCKLNEAHLNYELNAKLIASAPDLLDACLEFVRKCDCGEARSTKSYTQMKIAIKKALE